MARLKNPRAQFDDRLSLVDHLDELRNRIIVTLAAVGVAFGLCFWQDDLMLDIANRPLPADTPTPTTLGVTEPFFTTVEVAAYGAMVLAFPIVLYQIYAFVLPAFSPAEKRTLTPFLIAMPFLFLAGVAFAYFLVMPVAVEFLLNFNDNEFDTQVRARDYYSFFGLMLVAMGLLFQIPIAMLSLTRLEIVTPDFFAENRRYAIFIIAVVSAAAPGGDPISMLMIMVPLLLLYEGSIIIARRFGKPDEPSEDEPDDRLPADVSPGEAGS
jgi:sec-independent protein translocase protein TatC